MPALEEAKRVAEKVTGLKRPGRDTVLQLVRVRKAQSFAFADDGETPNNPNWPLVVYRSPVELRGDFDPAAIFEDIFASNGWRDAWRDGIYDFLHFHTRRHEVLGIARGQAQVAFGGRRGKHLRLKAGDVAILPAGTGHRRIGASDDLLVVGAYPQNSGAYDQPTPGDCDREKAKKNIVKVPAPKADPVYGRRGPLTALWHKAPATNP